MSMAIHREWLDDLVAGEADGAFHTVPHLDSPMMLIAFEFYPSNLIKNINCIVDYLGRERFIVARECLFARDEETLVMFNLANDLE